MNQCSMVRSTSLPAQRTVKIGRQVEVVVFLYMYTTPSEAGGVILYRGVKHTY